MAALRTPGLKLRAYILLLLLIFGLMPLILAALINLPLVLDRTALFYQRAYLQNLRADFRDLDQHLASRHELIRFLAKLPEPATILGTQGTATEIDTARTRYTAWINQILAEQHDVIQILFVDPQGQERFWLVRDANTQAWTPSAQPPQRPDRRFIEAGLASQGGAVMVSRIRVDADSGGAEPRQLMTLNLVSQLGGEPGASVPGVVVLTIDVGGLAQFYRDTLWVNHDGSYLRPGQPASGQPDAFATFPGLAAIFAEGKLALWKGDNGRQLLWVPLFLTEDGFPLWVGRVVDPSPLDAFRNELIIRVLSIIAVLVLVVMVLARWIAARVERFGHELLGGIQRILSDGQPLRFSWTGPRELRELGERLTELAATHAEHLHAARAHTRELEQSNRYKSQFLANVSHELRTPLNSILLLSKMLGAEGTGLTPTQRRQAQVIHEAGRDLRALIDNILDISRIESGRLALSLETVELRPMLEDLIELFSPQLIDKPVELSVRLALDAPESLHTDRDQLRQILKNFLANAIKFTERGEVRVEVNWRADNPRPLILSVIDTGIGIAPDKQDIIFEAFQQADGSTRRRYGGTGLGLAISRELATLLGGLIEVESSPGQGARFSLLLPLTLDSEHATPTATRITSPAAPRPLVEDEPSGLATAAKAVTAPGAPWVLIIERDVKTLVRLTSELARRGLRAQTAADLDEALETLRDEGEGCALVLLAAQMPSERTCDTIRALLAATPEPHPAVALLHQSPDADPRLQGCHTGGTLAWLATPVAPEALNALLANVLGTTSRED